MTIFELEYGKFELLPQRNQLSTTFEYTIEDIFENI